MTRRNLSARPVTKREFDDQRQPNVVVCPCPNLAGDCDGAHTFAQWLAAMIAHGGDNT